MLVKGATDIFLVDNKGLLTYIINTVTSDKQATQEAKSRTANVAHYYRDVPTAIPE